MPTKVLCYTKSMIKRGILILCAATAPHLGLAASFGNLMLLGDSMTGGAGSAPYAYRQDLAIQLVAGNHSFTNVGPLSEGQFPAIPSVESRHAGFGGWSTAMLLNGNGNPNNKLSNWLTTYSPNTVVWSSGHNDIWDILFNTADWNETAIYNFNTIVVPRFRQTVQTIFNYNSSTKLVIAAPAKMLPNGTTYRLPYSQAMRNALSDISAEWSAANYDVTFVDWWTATSDIPGVHFGPDNVHWNAAGANLAAGLVYEGLNPVPEPTTIFIGLTSLLLLRRRQGNK